MSLLSVAGFSGEKNAQKQREKLISEKQHVNESHWKQLLFLFLLFFCGMSLTTSIKAMFIN